MSLQQQQQHSRGLLAPLIKDFLALFGGNFCSALISFGFTILTTRLLFPADYGLFATLLFYLSLCSWMADFGLEQALLAQPYELFDSFFRAHLALRLVGGLLPWLLLIGNGYWVWLPGISSQLLGLLCLGFTAEKIGLSFKSWLEKHGRLRTVAWLELVAALTGSITAFLSATAGLGLLSLALQWAVQRLILLFGYWWGAAVAFRPQFNCQLIRTMMRRFAFPAFLASTFGLLLYDFMPFLLSKLTSPAQAGLYVRAFSLATMPLMITAVFGRILTTKVAQNIERAEALRHWFVLLQGAKALLIIPLQLGLMLTSPWWCNWLFAVRWQGLLPVYLMLAIYGLLRAFYDDVTVLLTVGFRRPWEFCYSQALQAGLLILLAPGLIFTLQATGAGLAMASVMLLVVLQFWWQIIFYLELSLAGLAVTFRQFYAYFRC